MARLLRESNDCRLANPRQMFYHLGERGTGMAMEFVTAVVEKVSLGKGQSYDPSNGKYSTTLPLILEATLILPDGEKAYLKTQVGEYSVNNSVVAVMESYSLTSQPNGWEWALNTEKEFKIGFMNQAFGMQAPPILMIAAGDCITIKGSVTTVTSKFGNTYKKINRAKLIDVISKGCDNLLDEYGPVQGPKTVSEALADAFSDMANKYVVALRDAYNANDDNTDDLIEIAQVEYKSTYQNIIDTFGVELVNDFVNESKSYSVMATIM